MTTRSEMHERGEDLLRVMKARPGATISALGGEMGLTRKQMKAILGRLLAEGQVTYTQQGAAVLSADLPAERSRPGLSAIARRKDIIEWLLASQVSPSMLAMSRCYAVSLPVIQKDIRSLTEAGAVVVDRTLAKGHQIRPTGKPWTDPAASHPLAQKPHQPRSTTTGGKS